MNTPILEDLRPRLMAGIYSEPGYLLREPGAGIRADVVLAALIGHDGQTVAELTFRGEAPAVWRTPRPSRVDIAGSRADPLDVSAVFDTDEWRCQNVYALVGVAAGLLPEYPHDDAFQVRVAGVIYELG